MIRRTADTQTETDFQIKKIQGINRGVPFESLPLEQFSTLAELNIFKGIDGQDKLRGRYGSNNIHPVATPTKWTAAILSSIVYDSGSTDYLIAQVGTAFYSQNLTTPGNPTLINDFAGAGYTLGSSVAADLAMSGARILVGHPAGNAVIELISGTFKIRTLGMAYPYITTVDVATSGALSGGWAYGIEKV